MLARENHQVSGNPLRPPFPAGLQCAMFALGCFWGAERIFWQMPGVYVTAVGYAGGDTADPTYREVCSGQSGHAEAVLVVYDPDKIDYATLLRAFWQAHDPTQGMRQGNDHGSQYRSVIFVGEDDGESSSAGGSEDYQARVKLAEASKARYQENLRAAGYGAITTEIIAPAPTFYYAEPEHQQYLAKNPSGYCGLGGTGVRYHAD